MGRFDELLKTAYFSDKFKAKYDAESYDYNKALSERQLFTQSNGRVLLGQDTMGRLHFISVPHEKDYALPTMITDKENHITACPGMYYQVDLTMFLGKVRYELCLSDGSILPNACEGSVTAYMDDFLPYTRTDYPGLEMDPVSIAPVLEKAGRNSMKTLPLPGPSGAVYGIRIKNTGNDEIRGKLILRFDNAFMSKYEHSGLAVEERSYPCVYSQVDSNLLLMCRPEGYTGIHMKGAVWLQDENFWTACREICLKPGEEIIEETFVCVSEKADGISAALGVLYMHGLQEWIQITGDFWRDRLGELTVNAQTDQELAVISRDIHIRNILDDFNCIQTDETGRVLVHWQGAPSHCYGRMWGIDVEPTTLSFIHIMPELGQRLIEYMIERNEPRYSRYPEHSVPIMMAPLIMAGKYYEFTGDKDYFKEHAYVWKKLTDIWGKIAGFRTKGRNLVPSRYSSDGIVMRRYDHGTNVKFWYASVLYAKLCDAMGEEKGSAVRSFACKLKQDILDTMVKDGPFGPQLTGGTNLGEQEDFYMNEDFFYYDGEDSSSVLAPVYGIYDYTFEPWLNYHRFARSVFASNYDPEMDVLRWFPYGGALDGTAYISALGGVTAKGEMKQALKNMVHGAVDETGSLYWWPKAENMRRMIARCSQGQGSWIVQYMKQWLGIEFDAAARLLIIKPMGMLDGYNWKGARLGEFVFDITYRETKSSSYIAVVNKNSEPFRVVFGCRPYGAGAQGKAVESEGMAEPGRELKLEAYSGIMEEEIINITETEARYLSDESGIVFDHFGFEQPYIEWMTEKRNVFLFRFLLINGGDERIDDVTVKVNIPDFMKIGQKEFRIWDKAESLKKGEIVSERFSLDPKERRIIPFWVELVDSMDASCVWFDRHPFFFQGEGKSGTLLIASEQVKLQDTVFVRLNYKRAETVLEKQSEIPVQTKTREELLSYAKTFLGALS